MRGATHHPMPDPTATGINAVVWIDADRALLVRGGAGDPVAVEIRIPAAPTSAAPRLAEVARLIGRVDHVLVLGTPDLRTALEREIVAIGHHPEVICEAVVERPVDDATLIERLRRLA